MGKLARDSRREARVFPEDSTWFNDESVQLAVREYVSRIGEGINHRSHGWLKVKVLIDLVRDYRIRTG